MAERKSVPLRIHPRLYEALRKWAEDDFRSVNGQIEWLCHQALLQVGRLPGSSSANLGSAEDVPDLLDREDGNDTDKN